MPGPETSSIRYVPIAIERAPAILGLHQVDNTTFVVGKTRISIGEEGLKITLLGTNSGQDSQFTCSSYELNTPDGTFNFTLENGKLIIRQEVTSTSFSPISVDEPSP